MEISKQIFLIWLGDNVPLYIKYVIKLYKEINTNFNIIFITYTLKQIQDIYQKRVFQSVYDSLLYDSIEILLNKNHAYKNYTYHTLIDGQKICYSTDIRMIQVLSDIYRLVLINNLGGIYVDCDTIPVRPFDKELLSLKSFVVCKHIKFNDKTYIMRDNYFMGTIPSLPITHNNEEHSISLLQTTDKWWTNPQFLILKHKFFKLDIKAGQYSLNKDFYIEHYCDGNWKVQNNSIRTPYCFLDKLINK